jgi:Arf-GAP/SH3 domain/ANK repeat/PH domain-containing protein
MFDNVNIDWRISHDDGSTDFSDDETLDDQPSRSNGLRTPEKMSSPNDKIRPLSVFHSPNNNNTSSNSGKNIDWVANTSDWSRSTPSDHGGDSPGSYRIMPPPPPPQNKKPSLCK